MPTVVPRSTWTRRTFLRVGGLATAAALGPALLPLPAEAVSTRRGERVLSFFNTHTGERLTAAYCCDGTYQADALARINHIMRDFRRNEVKAIDVKLLDLLHELGGRLRVNQPFHIISGYRSPVTNSTLRTAGGAHSGVATQSLHMVGKAVDIRIPGVRLDRLRNTARALKLGGVGYYPAPDFVHVDTGRVREW